MTEWWQVLLSVAGGIILLWLVLVFFLWREQRRHPDTVSLREMLRLVPDVIRLLKRLVGDKEMPVGVRVWLGVLFVYLISPIDVIPDFIPVLGYVDDAIVVAIALRFTAKHAGSAKLHEHWPGTPRGLAALSTFVGLHEKP